MFPADLSFLSFSRTSVRELHFAPFGKKKSAPWSAMIQFWRNRTGQVITGVSFSKMLHTPRGSFALSFVQFGTLLLNGQSFLPRWRLASSVKLSTGNPNTSARGWFFGILEECITRTNMQ